jgi:hypothetical protein
MWLLLVCQSNGGPISDGVVKGLFDYSTHPNTGLSGFIEFNLMPVSTI